MPMIVAYERVLERMEREGFVCNYYNGGAFGFARAVTTHVAAHVGPADPTIRPAALPFTIAVDPPYETNLARLAVRAWLEQIDADSIVWVMPMAHWAFELDHGSGGWMQPLLREIGVDAGTLTSHNNAAAIEFHPSEAGAFHRLVAGLLTHLHSSDFALAFPGHPVLCTVHHHRQLWWITSDQALAERLREVRPDIRSTW